MRRDELKFVYAVKPAVWCGALIATLGLFASRLSPLPRHSPDARFVIFLATFVVVTGAVAGWRLWRRARDPAAFRTARPQGRRADDDWRYWLPAAGLVLAGIAVWLSSA